MSSSPGWKGTTLSRVYAGIHYRFDSEAGLLAGRQLGALAIRRDQLSGP